VPDIAKSKGVSRQHIQNIMNTLQAEGYTESLDNPAHKRSALYKLTSKGSAAFGEMQAREQGPLRQLASSLMLDDLKHAEVVLSNLNRYLENEISRGETNERSSRKK
jgi:DNA-binding MarR family transcriptional regulator